MTYKHIPVMLREVLEYLNPQAGQNYIDCTLGGAGYSMAIAKKIGEEGRVFSFDMDKMAIENATQIFKKEKINNITLIHDNFRNLSKNIKEKFSDEEEGSFDGIVFDLGLSSAQLEDEFRGFSFKLDAPLNMAFGELGVAEGNTTESIINSYGEEELVRIFKDYGEEKFARKIAAKILEKRKENKIKTTKDLVGTIEGAVPASYKRGKIHFATKVFQALRIATNQELHNIEEALPQAANLLRPGGRIIVISYHSLEDRIVKKFFKRESIDCVCPPSVPVCVCGHTASLRMISRKPLTPCEEELKNNPRSRSAKMRIVEKK